MKMRRVSGVLLSIVLAVSLSACGRQEEAEPAAATGVNVTVFTAAEQRIENTVTYTGEVVSEDTASVTAQVSGTALAVYAEPGDYVTAGTVLLSIDDTSYRLAYNQAQAAYNSAVAAYNSATGGAQQQSVVQLEQALNMAKTEYNDAQANYSRQQELFDIGAIGSVALDAAKTRLETAELNLSTAQKNYDLTVNVVHPESGATAQASVDSARAALDIAANNLNHVRVTAPISGYVSAVNAVKGQMVSPGIELFAIQDTGSVAAEISVTEAVISCVSVGTPATVTVKSAGVENLEGSVTLVNPVKNEQTGMYTVRVLIPNENGAVHTGMFADVCLSTIVEEHAVVVPADAVLQDGDAFYVYVVNGDEAERRPVETGISDGVSIQLASGVSAGEQVVVSGKEYLSETNNKVRVVTE